MRIAVVHSFYSERQPSGENRVVADQLAQLSGAGHDVKLIARHTDDYSGNAVYGLRAAWTTMTGRGESPLPELAAFRPDVVHVHNTFPNWGTRWLERWGHRTVLTLHNYRSVCSNGLLFRDGSRCTDCLRLPVLPAIRHKCYRNSALASVPLGVGSSPLGGLRGGARSAQCLVALNDRAGAFFESVFRRPVHVVPNFVPAQSRRPLKPRRWVYVGRLSAEKGISVLIRNWPREEELDIIGSGPLDDALRSRSAGSPNVRIRGLVPREDVLSELSSYTGLVIPSVCAEGLPTVLIEALASGVPVLLSNLIDAASELVDAGAAVAFRPDQGPGDLTAALRVVVERRPQLAAAARRVHKERYSPEAWQSAMERIYQRVADRA